MEGKDSVLFEGQATESLTVLYLGIWIRQIGLVGLFAFQLKIFKNSKKKIGSTNPTGLGVSIRSQNTDM